MSKTKYEVDATQAVRAQEKLTDRLKKYEKEIDGTTKKLSKAEKAAVRLAKQADPTKRHAAEMANLAKQVKEGGLSLKDAGVLADRYDAKLARAGQSGKKAFGPLPLAQIGGMIGGFAVLTKAASLYTKELESQQQLFDKRVSRQISVDQSRAVLRRNLSGETDTVIAGVQKTATIISDATGVSEAFINLGLSEAVSASGVNIPASKKAVRAAARISPDSPVDIPQIAGTLLDLSKVTGTDDALVNLGYLSAVGAAGRVVDAKLQATNIAPGIIGTLPFGGNFKDSGSLFGSLSNAGADSKGAVTGTAIIGLSQQLEAFDKANASFDSDTLGGRISALQGNQQLAESFLAKATFEKKVTGPIRDLLTNPQSVAAQQYTANLQSLPGLDQLGARGQRAIDVLKVANPLFQTSQRTRLLGRAAETLQVAKASDQLSSQEIESVKTILQEVGGSRLGVDAGVFLNRLDGDGITTSEVQGSLRRRASTLRRPVRTDLAASSVPGLYVDQPFVPEGNIEAANTLNRIADKLDVLIGVNERTATAAEEAPINPQQE